MKILPDFYLLNAISIVVDTISIGLNIGFIVMLRVRQTKSLDKWTVKFAVVFSVLSIIFGACHMLTQPYGVIFDGIGIGFVASFLHDSPLGQYFIIFGISPCYIALLECGAFSFLYKYAATCNKSLHLRFNDRTFVGGLASIAIIWLLVAAALNDRFHTDFRNPHIQLSGMDMDDLANAQAAHGVLMLVATLNFFSMITCCLGTMIWCGWKIQKMIITNKLSERAKKVHKQALRLLILQASSPIFFVVFPVVVPLIVVNVGISMPDYFSWFNAYSLLLFPLLNPIIFVICTKDYRNILISHCCGVKKIAPRTLTSLSRNEL